MPRLPRKVKIDVANAMPLRAATTAPTRHHTSTVPQVSRLPRKVKVDRQVLCLPRKVPRLRRPPGTKRVTRASKEETSLSTTYWSLTNAGSMVSTQIYQVSVFLKVFRRKNEEFMATASSTKSHPIP